MPRKLTISMNLNLQSQKPSRSDQMVYSAVLAAWTVVDLSPELPPMLVDTSANM